MNIIFFIQDSILLFSSDVKLHPLFSPTSNVFSAKCGKI